MRKKCIHFIELTVVFFLFTCQKSEPLGSILITTSPTGAKVYLDGKDTGEKTDCTLENVLTVSHTIKLMKEGYEDYETTVTVEVGKEVEVSATLSLQIADIEWVHVPEGWFSMGSEDSDANSDEKPVHRVCLSGYYISKYEIVNKQYCKFLNAIRDEITTKESGSGVDLYYNGNPIYNLPMNDEWYDQIGMLGDADSFYVKSGKENYPVIEVTWYGAKAFCESYGWRLPTEAEWEKAARGTEKRKYHWGNQDPYYNGKYYANYDPGDYDSDGYKYTAPVGSYPDGISPYGCYDMAGDVCEWCNDWYDEDYYSQSPDYNPQGPSTGSYRVKRGGSWYYYARSIRCAFRNGSTPSRFGNKLGFRPVKDE